MSEMPNTSFSDRSVESLLAGGVPEDEGLAILVPVLAKLGDDLIRSPSPERVASFAAAAAALVAGGRGASEAPAPARRSIHSRVTRRLAIPLASAFLLTAMTGVGLASDDSAPGDILYGVDLALENVGVGVGGVAERLREASKLAERGNAAAALAHAAQAVGNEDQPDALSALEGLEAAVAELNQPLPDEDDNGHGALTRAGVAAMLQWMLENVALIGDETQPGAFGRGVAEMARQFSPAPTDPADIGEKADDADADTAKDGGDRGGPPPWVNPGGPPDKPGTP